MLNEETELIVRVGPGTPMGEMLRRYWIPAMLAEELPEPDGAPKKIRLLGEDLVAFRDTSGRVGIMDIQCPHRLASLALGRNEEGGIRCIYHGWKIDVEGHVLETPCEAPNSRFKDSFVHTAYEVRENADLIWVYMGPKDTIPPLPEFNWQLVPPSHRSIGKIWESCNFIQAMEGLMDTYHSQLLHSGFEVLGWSKEKIADVWKRPSRVSYGVIRSEETPYGFHYGAIREPLKDAETTDHIRITEYVAPFFCMNPPDLGASSKPFIFVPIDDENTMLYEVVAAEESIEQGLRIGTNYFASNEPIDHEDHLRRSTMRVGPDLFEDYKPKRNAANSYQQSRELMNQREKTNAFSGIDGGVQTQDLAMIESMGVIENRSKEHLGSSDLAVIAWRKRLVAAVHNFVEKGELMALSEPVNYRSVRAVSALVPKGSEWKESAWTARVPAHR